ncbi:hypothetical protein YC2023_099258 [Brassica napus]
MWELNPLHRTWYCKLPRITLLLQCNPILHLFSGLIEHSPNVLLSLHGLSEDIHSPWVKYVSSNGFSSEILKTLFQKLSSFFSLAPLFRCLATFFFLLLKVLLIGALSTSIGSAAYS